MTHPYAAIALEQCPERARSWLERALDQLDEPDADRRLAASYTGARRRLGDAPAKLSGERLRALEQGGIDPPGDWTLAEVGRAALLERALAATPSERHARLVQTLYSKGDLWEQRALLRALPILPGAERFLATAVDACRTNVVTVFAGIACHNSYPERHFPDAAYNQLVLKALFLEVPLADVRGLARRAQPELARMARDYAAERLAAGRTVPVDIARIPGCETLLEREPR